MKEPTTARELQEHMLWTYYGLRVGLAAIGIALPILVLVVGGVLHDVWLEPSISAYYHTKPKLLWFTTRDIFVGGLLAVAACLYLYKGFSNKENIALNLAGVFAALVALLPTAAADQPRGLISTLHMASAVSFFLCIAYVSLARSGDTLPLVVSEHRRRRYERLYKSTGWAMIASPAAAVVLSLAFKSSRRVDTLTFWVEALAVWSFAAYWIIKTGEMRESTAERRALDAELKRDVVAPVPEMAVDGSRAQRRKARRVEGIVPASQPAATP